jgi:hypothetical protein
VALISRIPRDHTTRDFRLAARQRFEEAKRSAAVGDRLIGVYLCGYAAEMLLKAAYFRFIGKKLTDPINMNDMRLAKGRANTPGIAWGRNFHDLPSWKELLIEERRIHGSSCSPSFGGSFNVGVANIHANWREDIRYHTNRPRVGEVSSTFQAAAWLMTNYPSL